ncbi:hypothetical protein QQ020_33405 [Fulvivirgaceae bacterium BMA12]|uniref:DUF7793 domain-containing protein n=1 Tax=Agaribacillus aureus TaxID=3051825 RepID=A0ABT8LJ14_9BACT|nr:hypothetical protein [Fulvivirgaceae bacterium BMA12]
MFVLHLHQETLIPSLQTIMEKSEKLHYLENEYVELWVEDGVIYEVFKPGTVMNLEAGKKVVADRLKVSNRTVMPLFVDMRQLININQETRRFMASKDAVHYLSAGAFLVKGMLTRLVFNTFLIISTPRIPTKGFTDKEKALTWLKYVRNVN